MAFVHVTAVRGHELPEVGDRVRFDLEENPKGFRANERPVT
jgi:cold shock CspA family protein